MKRLSAPWWIISVALYVFLYAPIAVVVVYSFNEARFGAGWRGFTTKWYGLLLENDQALAAARNTLILAVASTLVSTLLGTFLGYGLTRHRFPGRAAAGGLLYVPVFIPDIVMAVSLLLFYSLLRRWTGLFELGLTTMVLGQVTFQIPFVAIVVRSRLCDLDPAIEEAARDLGAGSWQTFRHVTWPMMFPGVMAGALLAFTLSLDDFVVSFFTSGPGSTTLPILIYSSVKRGITPDINALSTFLVLGAILGTVSVMWLQRGGTARATRLRSPVGRAGALLLWLLLASPLCAASGRLNVFIWSEYIDPKVVKEFEREFDCRVTVDVYEDAEAMLAKIQSGGASLYDIVVPPDHMVRPMVKLELLAPLRHENIPNLKNLDAQFSSPPYDPGNRYTVAYQWGTVGIYLRTAKEKPVEPTWGLLFDPRQQPGSFVLIDSVRDLVGAALKYRHHSLNSVDPSELKEARDLILDAKKRCAGLEGSVGGKNKVLGRAARAAVVYSGEAARGMAEDAATVYYIPREGSQIWLDNLVVPAKAPHRDLAEKFINFILEPQIGAQVSNFTQFATPNKASRAFIRAQDLQNPAIYPPPELMAKLEFLEDLGPNMRLYDEIWTQIKAR
jgi:ABC-type spermidine/putrescine transport system permease subunit II/ABC-type Fe3+ transport system substrate-binding protein